ncbi:hypothetical protein KC678_00715 [Candidatus Dojkabacteria bacterium]|uniref:50S ribosomal protein L32 n=1 Tax=Candidatus Dojkabacteria bacterium TaxID=2099670 RepID=A0A955IAQ2_9BACT|nr:hypothetical protein [Candidatus Dojkabacteria bacterium]
MAATPKRRRSASKRNSTRAAERYDKQIRKAKKIKKFGGSHLVKSPVTGKLVPAHRATKKNPEYNSVKVMREE